MAQTRLFFDESNSEKVVARLAYGFICLSTKPAIVFVFGYSNQDKVIKTIIGKYGVTGKSQVFESTTRNKLGTVISFIE